MTVLDLGPWECAGQDTIPTPPAGDAAVSRCRCGRAIWDPVSVSRGIGPVCWERITGQPPDVTARRHEVSPGQLAIDIPTPRTGPTPGDDYSI